MRLDVDECWTRLERSEHGVFGTVHPERAVDLVPVVYAVTPYRHLVIPVDTVKPKATMRLQRLVNLERDERCSLLIDEYSQDWSKLWWVRITGTATVMDGGVAALERFEQYRQPGAVAATIVVTPTAVTGWKA